MVKYLRKETYIGKNLPKIGEVGSRDRLHLFIVFSLST